MGQWIDMIQNACHFPVNTACADNLVLIGSFLSRIPAIDNRYMKRIDFLLASFTWD